MLELQTYRRELEQRPVPVGLSEEEWQHHQQKLVFAKMDYLLDHHSPVRHLEVDEQAEVVANAFLKFAGERYDLLAFVVMPSHHHWMFIVREEWALAER
mgnify:CR=1 FL=1